MRVLNRSQNFLHLDSLKKYPKLSFILVFCAYFSIILNTYLTIKGLDIEWTCKTTAPDQKYEYLCYNLNKATTCRHYHNPVSHHVVIDLQTEYKTYLSITCPWKIVQSEIRLIIDLFSIFVLSYMTKSHFIDREQISTSIKFFSYLLNVFYLLTCVADYNSLLESIDLNYYKCRGNLLDHLGSGVSITSSNCSYFMYMMTVFMSFTCAFFLLGLNLLLSNSKVYKKLDVE